MKITLALFAISLNITFAQLTPLEKNNYEKLTSYDELSEFIYYLDSLSDILTVNQIGKSVEGRNLYALKFSNSEFGNDETKIKILIFAQQHGNEQSGKEGALLLARELIKDGHKNLFDKIDLILIPQMNPDGSEQNQRRNGNGMDLNRNHLILTEPETIALHQLFEKYIFEVTMDVHEYWPYGETWKKFGYRKNFEVTIGALTNINVSDIIRNLSYQSYLPFIFNYISDKGYTAFHYLPGGPPDVNYIRYSTFDINDGRQSFGIQNTLSFIQEGINGEDYNTDRIEQRTMSQMTGMLGLLKYCYDNKESIKAIVSSERDKLINNVISDKISIQLEHVSDGEELKMTMLSYNSNQDTTITVKDFRSTVKSVFDVKRPKGYLIPKQLPGLKDWLDNHKLTYSEAEPEKVNMVEEYFIDSIGTIDFERDTIINTFVSVEELNDKIELSNYYFVPVKQLKNNMIVIALEPKSMLGLATYKQYEYLLKAGDKYPILRVVH